MISVRRILEICVFTAAVLLAAMAFHAWLASHDEQLRLQSTLTAQKQIVDAANTRERDRASALDKTLAQIQQSKREILTPEEILRAIPKYLPLPQPITMISPEAARESHEVAETQQIGKGTGSSEIPEVAYAAKRSGAVVASNSSSVSARGGLDGEQAGGQRGGHVVDPSQAENAAGGPAVAPPSDRRASESTTGNAQIPAADLKPLYDYIQDCRSCQAQLADAKQDRADAAAKFQAVTRERDAAVAAAKGGSFWRRLRSNMKWFALGAAAGAAASGVASGVATRYSSKHT